MVAKVKAAAGAMSTAFTTACSWAFLSVALYSLLFVNMTGRGALWDSLRGVFKDSTTASALPPANASVEVRVVPVHPVDPMASAQNRMLMIPDEPEKEISVTVLAQQQPPRFTDALADATVGKDWRKHLSGALRKFTVYGEGEQHSSASASVGASRTSPARAAVKPATPATPATVASAYRAGVSAEARPGVTDHVSQVDGGTGDGVRNFR